ncbi:MAG TPA: two-component regulator propeller domain-containing protein, partial [Chitinophagaceae bacterium]|nr:two-component regulator propeller domain-containing protein [Chitinophagaceae bacterium]
MDRFTRFFCILLLLMVAGRSVASPPSLYFGKVTTVNGLSNNKVNCILQDRRGFMWFGTDDGLNRYDGNKFVVFRNDPFNASSVSGNIVTNLLEDKDGIIWIATADGGLTRYDYRASPDKQFRQYKHSVTDSASIPVNIINALIEDPYGFLWLATSGNGVLRFNKHSEVFESLPNWGRTILSLCMNPDGRIWVGREGRGLLKIDPVTLAVEADERYNNVYNIKLPHMVVTTIFRDSRNNMWLGSWDKVVYRYDAKSNRKDVFRRGPGPYSFGNDDPISFEEDHRRRIWIGGKYGGLYIYDPVNDAFYHYQHDPARDGTLVDNQVNDIYRDRSGIIWLGTNRGISIHNPSQQQFEQTFLPVADKDGPVTIHDFFEHDGKLLIGASNGIYQQQPNGDFRYLPVRYKGELLAATKFFRSRDNVLYLGTNVSLFRFDPDNFSVQILPNTDKDIVMRRIIESRVVSVTEDTIDGHPVLLVSPYGHFLTYYDLVLEQWVSRQDTVRNIIERMKLRDHMVRRFFKSRSGQIWLANTKAGLGEWVNEGFPSIKYYANIPTESESISNNHVYDIAEDEAGNLWISTYGGGLHYFNTARKNFMHIQSSKNLSEGIQTDKFGNVWMIANGDLHKYDIQKKSYTTYQLPDVEKTGGIKGYIYKDASGRMYVAGINYFISFHPDSIRDNTSQPKVYLTDFKVFSTSFNHLLAEKKIELRHTQNFFSFEFAAPSYDGPVQYQWKLEGVDRDWVNSGSANYTNLSGGDYVFKVRATTRPGIWGNDIAMINVRIIPPFWKT